MEASYDSNVSLSVLTKSTHLVGGVAPGVPSLKIALSKMYPVLGLNLVLAVA